MSAWQPIPAQVGSNSEVSCYHPCYTLSSAWQQSRRYASSDESMDEVVPPVGGVERMTAPSGLALLIWMLSALSQWR
eukprot:3191392-Prymnesium_polylepis.1